MGAGNCGQVFIMSSAGVDTCSIVLLWFPFLYAQRLLILLDFGGVSWLVLIGGMLLVAHRVLQKMV